MDDLFETVADGALGKPTESISLAGFQVTRAASEAETTRVL